MHCKARSSDRGPAHKQRIQWLLDGDQKCRFSIPYNEFVPIQHAAHDFTAAHYNIMGAAVIDDRDFLPCPAPAL
eukprot:COSAG06_NODE_4139_length_4533_cov_73.718313_4_plen_74_part_00